jgi:hypothetical protein
MSEHPIPRKLAEIWEVHGGYHLRVEVPGSTNKARAEQLATRQALEAMDQILAQVILGEVQTVQDEYPPRGIDPFSGPRRN